MKKTIGIALALLCGAAALFADNLVKNGDFKTIVKGKASFWSVTGGCKVAFSASGASDGGFVRIDATSDAKGDFSLRQNMTAALRPNTPYKVSAKVRGTNFKANSYGLIFINEGWSKSSGIRKFPVTGEWTKIEAVVTTPDYKKEATLVLYANGAFGVLEVADVEVEPVAGGVCAPAA